MGPDMAVGGEPWQRALPSEWVPIIARDVQRQQQMQTQPPQGPFSDSYLSTQSAKRRKLTADNKPEGSVEQIISDTLDYAINASGVQPVDPIDVVVKEATGQTNLQQSLRNDAQAMIGRRLSRDPDYDPVKFPNSSNFAAKK
jgi:hypothetical protein